MIIYQKKHKLFLFLRYIGLGLKHSKLAKRFLKDSIYLEKDFRKKMPYLKLDMNEDLLCVSCRVCADFCPTAAIEIETSNLIDIPSSITTGAAPLKFMLNLEKCTKCALCVDICPVGAIALSGEYGENMQDLVSYHSRKRADL